MSSRLAAIRSRVTRRSALLGWGSPDLWLNTDKLKTNVLRNNAHLGDMAKTLNCSAVYFHGVQARFELPRMEGAGYTVAYLGFLRTVVFLRMLNASEESIRGLWQLERKLLQLLRVDSTGSPTWLLDACGQTTHPRRRLLLTNHDMGVDLPSRTLQLGQPRCSSKRRERRRTSHWA